MPSEQRLGRNRAHPGRRSSSIRSMGTPDRRSHKPKTMGRRACYLPRLRPHRQPANLCLRCTKLRPPLCRYPKRSPGIVDRKSTRLNSSHANISYAVFCLKKKKKNKNNYYKKKKKKKKKKNKKKK